MVCLGIDTSGETLSVGISLDQKIIGERICEGKEPHSTRLIHEMETLLKETGIERDQLNLIAISGGPGRYTALRVGMATAKGIAMAKEIPLVFVSTFQALACSQLPHEGPLCVVLDARRKLVYMATFEARGDVLKGNEEGQALSYDQAADHVPKEALLTGDGVPLIQPLLQNQGKQCRFQHGVIHGGDVARLGEITFVKKPRNDLDGGPIYIRKVEIHNPNVERR